MAAFEDRIIQNINSLIYLLRSQGIKAISTIKFLFLLNKKYRIELDEQGLEDVLSDNSAVTEIIDDKIIIDGKKQDEEDNTQNDIHDTAVDQAGENLTSESKEYSEVIKISENVKVGDIIEIQFGTRTVKVEVLDIQETTKKEEAKDLFKYL